MVESIGEDLMSGKVPNVLATVRIIAAFKHNPTALASKVAVAAVIVEVAGIYEAFVAGRILVAPSLSDSTGG